MRIDVGLNPTRTTLVCVSSNFVSRSEIKKKMQFCFSQRSACTANMPQMCTALQHSYHKQSTDLIAQIGRARVCSLRLCPLPFNIYNVKILRRQNLPALGEWSQFGIHLPELKFQKLKFRCQLCVHRNLIAIQPRTDWQSTWL